MTRNRTVDLLRGCAILLMVLDHFFVAARMNHPLYRDTVTRLACPLFCCCLGWCGASRGRFSTLSVSAWLLALCCQPLAVLAGLPVPEIMLQLAVVGLFSGFLLRWPVASGLVGVAWAYTCPGQMGYPLGALMAMSSIGVLAHRTRVFDANSLSWPWLEWVGRCPRRWYVGHLLVLWVLRKVGAL